MTAQPMDAGSDPRRLLAHVQHLTRRVRVAQRVTWLPLLALGVVMIGAIPAHRYGWRTFDCVATADGQVCRARNVALIVYWQVGLVVTYVAVAYGYLRAARARGVAGRVLPYVVTGIALNVLVQVVVLVGTREGGWMPEPSDRPGELTLLLFRLLDWSAAIGLALLVLAWLERHLALVLFTAGYLAVVLVPIDIGWGAHWSGDWQFLPALVVQAGVLLLGALGFAMAQRPWRQR